MNMIFSSSYFIRTTRHVFNVLSNEATSPRQLVVSEHHGSPSDNGVTQWEVEEGLTDKLLLEGLKMGTTEIAKAVREFAEKKLDVLKLE